MDFTILTDLTIIGQCDNCEAYLEKSFEVGENITYRKINEAFKQEHDCEGWPLPRPTGISAEDEF